MNTKTKFQEVQDLARHLSSREKVRLLSWLGHEIERDLDTGSPPPTRSLLGLVKDLGPAPSEEQIDEARTEAWSKFSHDDI